MFAVSSGISGNILNFDAARFITNESSQFLLVAVYNVIYPIAECVLHQVFDPYGYVEKIDILQLSEPLQALIQFDSCQNAVSAKNQLQGRYIYESCCQLDIHFYTKNNTANQTGNIVMKHELASALDFMKNKLHEMMVIIERMQDRIRARNSSSLYTATVAAKSTITTLPCTRSEIISQPSNLESTETFDFEAATVFVDSESTQVYDEVCAKERLQTIGPVAIDQHEILFFYSQKAVAKMGFKTLQSPLEMSINQLGKSSNGAPLVSTVGDGIKMHFNCQTSSATTEQYGHILFDVMLERNAKKIFERTILIFDPGVFADASTVFAEMNKFRGNIKIFIFDPGGTLAVERVSDLEDKVDLEGVGNDAVLSLHLK